MSDWNILSSRYLSEFFSFFYTLPGNLFLVIPFFILPFVILFLLWVSPPIKKDGTLRRLSNPTVNGILRISVYAADIWNRKDQRPKKVFFILLVIIGIGYASLHVLISFKPTILIEDKQPIQHLSSQEIKILLEFLQRWVVLGLGLLTLQLSFMLSYFELGMRMLAEDTNSYALMFVPDRHEEDPCIKKEDILVYIKHAEKGERLIIYQPDYTPQKTITKLYISNWGHVGHEEPAPLDRVRKGEQVCDDSASESAPKFGNDEIASFIQFEPLGKGWRCKVKDPTQVSVTLDGQKDSKMGKFSRSASFKSQAYNFEGKVVVI